MAAKIYLEHLNLVDEGFTSADEGVQRAKAQGSNVLSRFVKICLIETEHIMLTLNLIIFYQSLLVESSSKFYQVA